jgi:AcrR family transcriptional regulator
MSTYNAPVDVVNRRDLLFCMTTDTRDQLVDAAAKLLDRGGPAAVTLRDVGKRAGVSHNAPYKHFDSKEDLLAAVASRELNRQSKAMSAAGSDRGPLDALRALMHGYVRWARKYPERFRLTFGAWTHDSKELGDAAAGSRARLIAIAEAAQQSGELPKGNPERIAYLILALAHGAADLSIAGHLSANGKGAADPEMLIDDLIRLLRRNPRRRGNRPMDRPRSALPAPLTSLNRRS